MKTIRKKTTGYKVENLKEDITQDVLDNLPEGSGGGGGSSLTKNTITISFNSTDFPVPDTNVNTDYTLTDTTILSQLKELLSNFLSGSINSIIFYENVIMPYSEDINGYLKGNGDVSINYEGIPNVEEYGFISLLFPSINTDDNNNRTVDYGVIAINIIISGDTIIGGISVPATAIDIIRQVYNSNGSFDFTIEYII